MGEDNPHHGNKWMPCLYASYFGLLKEIAERHGYALAIHGSFTRDMDLILVPWTEKAGPHEDVLKEWEELIGINYDKDWSLARKFKRSEKPHGRVSYAIPTGGGGYVDVSVMPLMHP